MGTEGGQRSFHRHSLTMVGLHRGPSHAETQRFAIPVASGLWCLRGSVLRSPPRDRPQRCSLHTSLGAWPQHRGRSGTFPRAPSPTVGSGGALGAVSPGVSRCPVPGISCSGGRAGRHSSPEPGAAPPWHTAGPAAMGPAAMGPMGSAVMGPAAMGPAVEDPWELLWWTSGGHGPTTPPQMTCPTSNTGSALLNPNPFFFRMRAGLELPSCTPSWWLSESLYEVFVG